MSMSVSILSETSKDELETDDKELQELVWNLMSRSGLLSEMQGRISKFLEENGKDDKIHIIPGRADARLLGLIFEYLQWVGMKQTNSVLLSESPVEVDLSTYEGRSKGVDYKPKLCKLLEEGGNDDTEEDEEGDDRLSPSKSQNYSKDEFDDSKLTSVSQSAQQPSAKGNDEEVEDLASDNEEDEEEVLNEPEEPVLQKSQGQDNSPSRSKQSEDELVGMGDEKGALNENTPGGTEEPPLEQNNTAPAPSPPAFATIDPEMTEDGRNDMLIDFNSPIKPKGTDQARPHVTVRQRLDLGTAPADPFQSPRGFKTDTTPNFSIPGVNRLDFLAGSNPAESAALDEVSLTAEKSNKPDGDGDNNFFEVVNETAKPSKVTTSTSKSNSDKGPPPLQPEQNQAENLLKEIRRESPDDDSTSDFMETLTMEEDTQDVSIPSDTKGMSSCEHAVNFK